MTDAQANFYICLIYIGAPYPAYSSLYSDTREQSHLPRDNMQRTCHTSMQAA